MDVTALVFYALVCGALSLFAPRRGGQWMRFGVGAAVGIAAALTLPFLKGMMPY